MQKITKMDLERIIKEEFGKMMGGESDDNVEVDGSQSEMKTDLETIAQQALNASKHADDEDVEAWVKSHILAAKELLNHVEEFFGEGQPESIEHEEEETPEEEAEEHEETINEDSIDKDVARKEVDYLSAKEKQIKNTISKKKMAGTSNTATIAESEEWTDEEGNTWNDEGELVASGGRRSIKAGRGFKRGYKDTFNQRGERGGENLDWMRQGINDMDENSRISEIEQKIQGTPEFSQLMETGLSLEEAMDSLMQKYGQVAEAGEINRCPGCGEWDGCMCPPKDGGQHAKSPMQKTQKSVPAGIGSKKKKVTISEANMLREIAKKMKSKGEHGKLKSMIDRLEGKKK